MRRISEIHTTSFFDKRYRILPVSIKTRAKARERIFRKNAFDFRLRTHKLHGKNKEYWAFWIDYHYRIKFVFIADDVILFIDVGTHDQVY